VSRLIEMFFVFLLQYSSVSYCFEPDALGEDDANLYAMAHDFATKEMLPHAEVRCS
jgi:hypothetical protein